MSTVAPTRLPAASTAPGLITVEEYHRMIDRGEIGEDDRVELLNGRIVDQMTKHPPHVIATRRADRVLTACLPAGWHTRSKDPITLDDSEPEPDVVAVRGELEDYPDRHPGPTDLALIVEVADSSLSRDREKALVYARNEIPCYWIINLFDASVEVYDEPGEDESGPRYARVRTYVAEESVPLVVGDKHLDDVPVADLLP